MRRGLRFPIVVALAAGMLALPGAAANAQCFSSTILEIDVVVTKFYYEDRSDYPYPPPGLNFWIYEETNGQSGLQRGGAQWILDMAGQGDLDRDFCVDSPTPDRLWF